MMNSVFIGGVLVFAVLVALIAWAIVAACDNRVKCSECDAKINEGLAPIYMPKNKRVCGACWVKLNPRTY